MSEPTWVVVQDDTFQRADTSTGSAGSTTAVSNQWVNVQGGVWQIAGDVLKGTSDTVDATGRKRDFLLRPTNETPRDAKASIYFSGTLTASQGIVAILRYQSSGGPPPQHYLLGILPGGESMNIYAIAAGGTATGLATAATVSLTAGHNYRLDARAWGVAPTNLALDLYDLAGPTNLATLGPIADSTAGLQAAGQMGIVLNTSATSTSITLSEVSCSIAGTLIGPADQHLYFSPGSWSDGSGTMQPNNVLPGSTEVIMCQPGAISSRPSLRPPRSGRHG